MSRVKGRNFKYNSKTVSKTFSFPTDLIDLIQAEAAKKGVTPSELVIRTMYWHCGMRVKNDYMYFRPHRKSPKGVKAGFGQVSALSVAAIEG